MKNYNIELPRESWERLRAYLIENDISFESSECFNLVHITIWCNQEQAENINKFLEA